jgi:hypothetical protein
LIGRLVVVFAGLSLASSAALGVEVVESLFQVTYTHGGREYVADDHVVPLLPGNACYYWYLRLAETNAPVHAVERFTLPEPLTNWGTTGATPEDPTQIEEDGKVAVTTLELSSDNEGWISHGWCAAEGDPLGLHLLDVSAGGVDLAKFEFDVVAPANYDFPTAPAPDPNARSTNNSW